MPWWGPGSVPADLTWRAGVDALTFGATKNGALAAEAVVFFNQRFSDDFAYRRKRAGHLWVQASFSLAAQFDGFLNDDLWLQNARHANDMAYKLAAGLADISGVTASLADPKRMRYSRLLPEPLLIAAWMEAGFCLLSVARHGGDDAFGYEFCNKRAGHRTLFGCCAICCALRTSGGVLTKPIRLLLL